MVTRPPPPRLTGTPPNSCWGACHVTPFVCFFFLRSRPNGGFDSNRCAASEQLSGRLRTWRPTLRNKFDDGVAHLECVGSDGFGYSVSASCLQACRREGESGERARSGDAGAGEGELEGWAGGVYWVLVRTGGTTQMRLAMSRAFLL